MIRVCFVCLGNICRSPTAEGVFKTLVVQRDLSAHFEIDSAGTAGYHVGAKADSRSIATARRRGYSLTSLARQFLAEDLETFDYVLAMDQSNLSEIQRLRPARPKAEVALLRSFDPSAPPHAEVPDPYYGGDAGFDLVLDVCESACNGLLDHLLQRHPQLVR